MTPLLPAESRCASEPSSTHVTISMSRCGWVSKPAPGATMSSLLNSNTPWWVLPGLAVPSEDRQHDEFGRGQICFERTGYRLQSHDRHQRIQFAGHLRGRL